MSENITEGRPSRRRPSRRVLVTGAAAIVVAALGTGVIVHQVNAPNVPASLATQVPRPSQIPVNAPVAAAPADATLTSVVDVTSSFRSDFAGNVADVRSRVQGDAQRVPTIEEDACLTEWAKGHLPELAARGAYEVLDVCGRQTAVLAGPAGADAKVLVYGALEKTAPAGAKALFGKSTSNRLAFVAVRSDDADPDSQAQLMAAAVLPAEQEVVYDGTQSEEPPVINTLPPLPAGGR